MLRFNRLFLAVPLVAALSACGDSSNGTGAQLPPTVTVETVKLIPRENGSLLQRRRFLGRLDAVSTVDYAFQVGGKVAKVPVVEGQIYEKETLLAELDQTDYNLALREAQASFDLAKADLTRKRTLVRRNAASQADLDASQADYRLKEVALERANINLSYTTLKAPFDALITRRLVEPETIVGSGTAVLRIQDVSELRVKISVPEDLMRGTRDPDTFEVVAVDKGVDGTEYEFPLEFRENNTEPDEVTQTFTVTFGMPRPEQPALLPGMTVTVLITPRIAEGMGAITVPIAAVATDADGKQKVFVYNPEDGTVTGKIIEVGAIAEERVIVNSGLSEGDVIVAAGAKFLRDGMKVRLPNGQNGQEG